MEHRTRTTYTKREVILNERTLERVEEQAHDRGVSFHAMAEAMLEEMLNTLERDDVHFNWLASFERRARNVHEEIEGAS